MSAQFLFAKMHCVRKNCASGASSASTGTCLVDCRRSAILSTADAVSAILYKPRLQGLLLCTGHLNHAGDSVAGLADHVELPLAVTARLESRHVRGFINMRLRHVSPSCVSQRRRSQDHPAQGSTNVIFIIANYDL